MPQWSSMPPQPSQEMQGSGSELSSQLSPMMPSGGAPSAAAASAVGSQAVGNNNGAPGGAAARSGGDVMQQFRAQPATEALSSNFSALGFGDNAAPMPRSPQKTAPEPTSAVQPQEMSAFSDPAQSLSAGGYGAQYGQVASGAGSVPSQGQHQYQSQQAPAPSQQTQPAAPQQQVQAPVQGQQPGESVYDSSSKDGAQDAYGMGAMGADAQAAQQAAYSRSMAGYAGASAAQAGGAKGQGQVGAAGPDRKSVV